MTILNNQLVNKYNKQNNWINRSLSNYQELQITKH